MKKLSRNKLRLQRKKRVRANVFGTSQKPRFLIFKSIRNIYVQVVDDNKGLVLASASLKDLSAKSKKSNLENAGKIGKLVAEKCSKAKITAVVFDRGGYKYHGKVKALAEEARKGGLKF
ncbi:50S ribosomal protein L18 [bacterium BMS3Abin15]|nr:50S ribosomal protein L18 [bacterium BMS3Abin15]HDZ85012.1 50S ribosomal protein L18 [Candidatus Moranbacteria bacterium]